MFTLTGSAISCIKAMSMSCFRRKSMSISTRVGDRMPFMLRLAILIICMLYLEGWHLCYRVSLEFASVCSPAGPLVCLLVVPISFKLLISFRTTWLVRLWVFLVVCY